MGILLVGDARLQCLGIRAELIRCRDSSEAIASACSFGDRALRRRQMAGCEADF
jgi:hypothetical protein